MPLPWLKSGLTEQEIEDTRGQYTDLIEYYSAMKNGSWVAFYTQLANKMSAAIARPKPWTWRYPQGVYKGDIIPSRDFARAVSILLAEIDGLPAIISRLERVEVYAEPGQVQHDAIVMGKSKVCATPECNRVFVPNVPNRTHCPLCRPPKR